MGDDLSTASLVSILLLLLFLSAFFSGTETALMRLNRYKLKNQVRKGNKSAKILEKLLKEPEKLIGLICLYQLNIYTWFVAVSAIPLVILYPLAKRFTKWPQIILGLTFSWAVPTAWSAANEEWNLGIFIMYLATVFWIIGYDTIYGCQDKNEDEIFGIKNSAVS